MSKLFVQPTSTAQWHALVNEAEAASGCILNQDIESYLVFLLMRYTNKPHMISRILGLDYLQAGSANNRVHHEKLRDVGDHCLLFSGLFPQHAEKRMVKISYFVDLGRVAYHQVAEQTSTLMGKTYANLSREFVSLMDILQTMRTVGGKGDPLAPIHAFELWHDTGSQHAYKTIRSVTDSCPVKPDEQQQSGKTKPPKLLTLPDYNHLF